VDTNDAVDLALALARVWLGIMIFAHGWRHLQSIQTGPGIANWFESLGLKPGPFHAWNVTVVEFVVGVLLIVGLLTPLAYAGLAALMIVAVATAHRSNGFFINNPGQGWEYVVTTAVVAISLGTLGPGQWSLDNAFGLSFPFDPDQALPITAIVGIGGAALFLALFWRPPRPTDAA
jgi:putative oxidoreductase